MNTSAMWQDTISIYKHELYSYTSNEQSIYETKKTILLIMAAKKKTSTGKVNKRSVR